MRLNRLLCLLLATLFLTTSPSLFGAGEDYDPTGSDSFPDRQIHSVDDVKAALLGPKSLRKKRQWVYKMAAEKWHELFDVDLHANPQVSRLIINAVTLKIKNEFFHKKTRYIPGVLETMLELLGTDEYDAYYGPKNGDLLYGDFIRAMQRIRLLELTMLLVEDRPEPEIRELWKRIGSRIRFNFFLSPKVILSDEGRVSVHLAAMYTTLMAVNGLIPIDINKALGLLAEVESCLDDLHARFNLLGTQVHLASYIKMQIAEVHETLEGYLLVGKIGHSIAKERKEAHVYELLKKADSTSLQEAFAELQNMPKLDKRTIVQLIKLGSRQPAYRRKILAELEAKTNWQQLKAIADVYHQDVDPVVARVCLGLSKRELMKNEWDAKNEDWLASLFTPGFTRPGQ